MNAIKTNGEKGGKCRYFIEELNKWVSSGSMKKVLVDELGMNPQEYYDFHVLGVSSESDRPTCSLDGCNNKVKFLTLTGGYSKFCCTSHQSRYNWTQDDFWEKQRKNNPTHGSGGLMEYIKSDEKLYAEWKSKSPGCQEGGLHKFLLENNYESYKKLLEDGGRFGRAYSDPESDLSFLDRSYGYYKTGEYLSVKSGLVFFKSSYEERYLELMDNDERIEYYEYEKIRLRYHDTSGKSHLYLVDFLIHYTDNTKELVEVKPSSLLNDPINVLKFESARRYSDSTGIPFRIVTEKDLWN